MQRSFLSLRQGDRIVRIFAYWAIDYFGQFFENYRISTHTLKTFSTVKVMHSFWSKMSMGYILGVFSQTHLVTLLSTLFFYAAIWPNFLSIDTAD
jgi:hypothetical protein